jgi:NAD(P)-dependent dehydrogenase (short-subunit alcohol dehydrogenase family)
VVFTGRDRQRGGAVTLSTGARFIPIDHADRAVTDRAFQAAVALLDGRIDVLVANAAVVYRGPLTTTPDSVMRELLEVNVTSPFRLSRAYFEVMGRHGHGAIVHIASDSAIRGIATIPAYSVSKAALHRLSTVLAAEGGPLGIRVNVVCPGATPPGMRSTPRGYESHAEDSRGWTSDVTRAAPSAIDVAAVVAWLASDEAQSVSGASITVDGAASAAIDLAGPRRDHDSAGDVVTRPAARHASP